MYFENGQGFSRRLIRNLRRLKISEGIKEFSAPAEKSLKRMGKGYKGSYPVQFTHLD